MKSYRCAYCDRQFELSDDAVPHIRDGQNICEMCLVEME
jgi:DNA-directed RNA polymerase subunit RPC12/RpoP